MMIVNEAGDMIGTFQTNSRYLPGDVFDVRFVDFLDGEDGLIESNITLKVENMRRTTRVSEIAVMNEARRFGIPDAKGSQIVVEIARHIDPAFNIWSTASGAAVTINRQPENMGYQISVNVPVVKVDIDMAERLFDMNQFTPL